MKQTKTTLWSAWVLVSFFYAYQYILRVMPSILMVDIVNKYSLTPVAFGQFSGVYYLGYAFMHLPVGIFLDRFGPKKVLPLLIGCTALGLLPILYADAFIYPILGRVCIGIGSSGAILGIFKVLHLYFDPKKFSRFLSFSVMVGLLGAVYGGAPIHFAREHFGFENVVFALILFSLVLAVFSYFFLPENPVQEKQASVLQNLKNVFSNKSVLIVCLVAGCMVGPLEGFADVWGVQFLKIFHGVNEATAAGLPSWIYVGMFFGGPFLDFIMEKSEKPLYVILSSGLVMSICFALLLNVQMSATALSVLFFVVGLFSAYQILVFYQVATYVGESDKNLSSVVANMIIMSFGYIFHSGIGKLIHFLSIEEGVDGFHNAHILSTGILIIPVALVISVLIMLIFMRRKTI